MASNSTSSMESELKGEVDRLGKSVGQIKDDLKELANSAASHAREGYRTAREQVRHAYDSVRDRAHDQTESLRDTIISHPVASVGVAVGVGVLVGLLMSRRS
jgi:ElaB/YqjD/DUF883 family membrane-anchored ribosome-binding protein